ncbi:MAG: peptidoglycan bridge formation glycyltransferase FemA/FemB family protein [Rhodospirillaceae bacterium]|nr:peptidoglycan bridge formation glycyltransferase FemA/FemB family protein [Rhodospirillaceae bacterium]
MLRIEFPVGDDNEWTDRVATHEGLSLLQCGEYGATKAALDGWRVERGIFIANGDEVGAFQALIKRLPIFGGGLAWVNRGPLALNANTDTIENHNKMLAALKAHYAQQLGYYLRIAPNIPAEDPPAETTAPMGFALAGSDGWASAIIDLTQSEEQLRAALRGNWRSTLNKAERAGMKIRTATEGAGFDEFVGSYQSFIDDRAITTSVTPALIENLQTRLSPENKLSAYLAHDNGKLVAGILIARFGQAAEYLAASSTDAGRRAGAGQILLWRAILDAKAEGRMRFDVGGMDPDLTPPGIFKFKQGLGGTPYRLAREIETLGGHPLSRLVRWRVRRAR